MINLFEYQNKETFSEDLDGLETFLNDIWRQREKSPRWFQEEVEDFKESQQFLQILHKAGQLKSNKYVGVIHFAGQKINLLPKIFYDGSHQYVTGEIHAIHKHILWWLSYCKKIKFPSYSTSLGSEKSDFFEVLIYMFAKYTRELLNHSIYQQYQETEQEMQFVRGRLNIPRYVTENMANGRWHKVSCVIDPFVLDNRFNQIIKYVTRLLLKQTSSSDSRKYLTEILFKLDEVSDVQPTAEECLGIRFNASFAAFDTVRDYCHLFLSHSVSFDYKNDLKLFAFLLPMEYLFEDFVVGFIEKHVPGVKVRSQSASTYLDQAKNFSLKPDIILSTANKRIIADTKYKMVYRNAADPKKGITQTDLYQVVAYAIRYKISDVLLLYPDTTAGCQEEITEINIRDEFAEALNINIYACQLPIINRRLLAEENTHRTTIKSLFSDTEETLKQRIEDILGRFDEALHVPSIE